MGAQHQHERQAFCVLAENFQQMISWADSEHSKVVGINYV